MKYAIVENGVVVNIALAEKPMYDNWIEATDAARIGGTWDGTSFGPVPQPDPAEALAAERAGMVCSRRQGKLAIGPAIWADVEALAAEPDTPWGLRVAVYDAIEWHRTDEDMAALIWAMNLTDEQADDLFRLAVTL